MEFANKIQIGVISVLVDMLPVIYYCWGIDIKKVPFR